MIKENKSRMITVVLRVVSALCLILIACAAGRMLTMDRRVQTGDAAYVLVAPYQWHGTGQGIAAADREFQSDTKLVTFAELTEEAFVSELKHAAATEPDGILAGGTLDTEAVKETLKEIRETGIPIVLLENDLGEACRDVYIGIDNTAAGRLAGEELAEATGGSARIGVVVSDLDTPNQKERLQGLKEALAAWPELEIAQVLECHLDEVELVQKVSAFLEEEETADAICILEGWGGNVLGPILESQYAERELDIVVFGSTLTTLDYVSRGFYFSTIAQDQVATGYRAVEVLDKLQRGEDCSDSDIIYTDLQCVRAAEAQERMTEQADGGFDLDWHYFGGQS